MDLLADDHIEITAPDVVGITIMVYMISLLLAMAIRRSMPVDWLIPMYPLGAKRVGRRTVAAELARRFRHYQAHRSESRKVRSGK